MFAADAKGGDVRIIGCHWIVVPHGIYAKSDIKSVKDLKGKQIAVSAPNSMPDLLARAALEANTACRQRVKLAAVGGDRERYQALIGGVVQAAVVSNEYQPIAPKNVHLLLAGRDALPNFLRVCMMSTAKKLAERGDDAVNSSPPKWTRSHYALTHKAETVALTQRDHAREAGRSARRPSSTTTRSSITRSIRRCRCRRTSSTGSRTRWSRRAS